MSKPLVIGTMVVVVGLFALGGFVLWQMQPTLRSTPADLEKQAIGEQRDAFCTSTLVTLQDAAEYYLQKYGNYPTEFLELDEYLNELATTLQNNCGQVYYSYYPSVKPSEYHLGVQLESCTFFARSIAWQSFLKNDADFDSFVRGWKNGFYGKDNNTNCPDDSRIFDVTSGFRFRNN